MTSTHLQLCPEIPRPHYNAVEAGKGADSLSSSANLPAQTEGLWSQLVLMITHRRFQKPLPSRSPLGIFLDILLLLCLMEILELWDLQDFPLQALQLFTDGSPDQGCFHGSMRHRH